mmetsp:Transcript_5358/g.13001  ORF Transcript_5358/g.13001 Transcript_5358/m.13001 type:complete len:99 (-) Transcript_5358:419-715(-)
MAIQADSLRVVGEGPTLVRRDSEYNSYHVALATNANEVLFQTMQDRYLYRMTVSQTALSPIERFEVEPDRKIVSFCSKGPWLDIMYRSKWTQTTWFHP